MEKVHLDDRHIRPIGEVGDVRAERVDVRDDDDLPDVLDKFLAADIVAVASPVYWHGVSAQMKCFFDRLSAYFGRPPYAERFPGKGFVVLTAYGQNEPGYGRWVTEPVKTGAAFLGGRYLGDVCVTAYAKGEVGDKPEVLEAARGLGHRAVREMAEGG